jgi:hypothetical protein
VGVEGVGQPDKPGKLTCTRVIRKNGGVNGAGKTVWYSGKCGAPASEVEIKGFIASVKAILCVNHAAKAEDEAFVSTLGYPKGKIDPSAKEKGYKQQRLDE